MTGSNTRRRFLQKMLTLVGAASTALLSGPAVLAKTVTDYLSRIKGRVVLRSDPSYPQWWNSMSWFLFLPKRYPDLIVRAKSEEDIVAALAYAREHKLRVTARSGGHNPSHAVLRDGGMLLDLSLLRAVDVDPVAQTAWVEPGIHAENFIALLDEYKLDFPSAHTGVVPIGGYVMGGGLGWNMPQRGIACRSILAAEVIMADGSKLLADATQNTDLLWAIRGCGPGFFGVITRYKLQLYPLYSSMTKSKYLFAIDKLPQLCEALKKVAEEKENRVEILAVVGRFYPPDKPPEERDLVCAVSVFAFANSTADATELMAPWQRSGLPAEALIKSEDKRLSYEQMYAGQETDHSSPNRTAVENIWTDDVATGLQALAQKMIDNPPPSPRCFALSAWGFNNTLEDSSSCVSTPSKHYLSWYLMAEEESHVPINRKWMDESVALLRPITTGHYINETDPLHYPEHAQECFTPGGWKRLAELRDKYDPDRRFFSWLGQEEKTS